MTTLSSIAEINGTVDPNESVLSNLTKLANASGCFVTWDPSAGKWSVIINDTAPSVMTFDDTNIISSINITGTGISELYNAVTIEFPHRDLRDTTDYIDLRIPESDRFPQELDNTLNIRLECINNPLQAQYIASRELKQSRVDTVVDFRTDYTANGLSAGDVISVNNSIYGYNGKKFRIISIEEEDGDDGSLIYAIQALEYDPDVYTTQGLVIEERTKKTGIVPKAANQSIILSDDIDTTQSFANVADKLGIGGLLQILNQFGDGGIPFFTNFTINVDTSTVQTYYNNFAGNVTGWSTGFSNGDPASIIIRAFQLPNPVTQLNLNITAPLSTYDYYTKINGSDVLRQGFVAYVPSQIDVFDPNNSQTTYTIDWQANAISVTIEDAPAGIYQIGIKPLLTYDLDQEVGNEIFPFNHSIMPNANGAGITFTGSTIKI